MNRTKITAAVLALPIALSALAGCKFGPLPQNPGSPTSTVAPTTTSAPTTTAAPTTAPTTSAPTSSPQAAGKTLVAGDEFNYTGAPASAKWGMYDGEGHGGNGTRTPKAFNVDGSKLIVTGNSSGATGGMAYKGGQKYGYWEARIRVPKGGSDAYHPVLLMWPDAENWPVGGEIDYYETSASSNSVDFFLHYGKNNNQTHGEVAVDQSQWNVVGMEWTASGIRGFMNGKQFFSDTNTSHLPPGPMHMTIQLDYFPGDGKAANTTMEVDYIRQYK